MIPENETGRSGYVISRESPLVLASASPRRKELLSRAGIPFRSVASRVREDDISGDPHRGSILLAEKKARRVSRNEGASWILGADTVVAVDHRILGKPKDPAHAARMLSWLEGREHRVITGFCILIPEGGRAHLEAVATRVRFKPLTRDEIDAYIQTGEPFGKAGGYAIQGIGAFMVEGIFGSYTNVVGLPLCALIRSLVSTGALPGYPPA